MSQSQGRVPIPGAAGPIPPDARALGPIDPGRPLDVTVRVRPRAPADPARIAAEAALPPADRAYPSREAFAAAHGADPADLAKVEAFARAHGLAVEESRPDLRSVRLSGPASALASVFGVGLAGYLTDLGTFHAPSGPVTIPAELAGIVEAVIGLDDRPHASPRDADAS